MSCLQGITWSRFPINKNTRTQLKKTGEVNCVLDTLFSLYTLLRIFTFIFLHLVRYLSLPSAFTSYPIRFYLIFPLSPFPQFFPVAKLTLLYSIPLLLFASFSTSLFCVCLSHETLVQFTANPFIDFFICCPYLFFHGLPVPFLFCFPRSEFLLLFVPCPALSVCRGSFYAFPISPVSLPPLLPLFSRINTMWFSVSLRSLLLLRSLVPKNIPYSSLHFSVLHYASYEGQCMKSWLPHRQCVEQ